jgi:hypothetical protein
VTAVQPARAGLSSEPGVLPGSRRARGPASRPQRGTPPQACARENVLFRPRVDRRAELRAQLRARVRAQLRTRALARARSRDDNVPPARDGDRARKPPVAA